jgi:tetratricopeptide (TPR) repeat protein
MRARIVFFGALILVGGCRTPRTSTHEVSLTLTRDEHDLAAAMAHFALGSFYEQSDGPHSPDAIQEFELASQYDPARHRIRSKIAVGYLMARQPSKAIAALETSCRHNPRTLQPHVDLAITCQLAGQLDPAVANFEKAIELAPDQAALYASVAKIHIHRNEDDAARDALRRGIRASDDPVLLQMLSTRGRQLIGKKQFDQALLYFKLLGEEGGDTVTPALHNLVGQIYLELTQLENAVGAFEQASRGDQPPAETFTKLGATLMFLGRHTEAVARLEQGRALHPHHTRLLFSLGLAYSTADRTRDAVDTFAEIERLSRTNPGSTLSTEFYVTYGAVCERVGQARRADAIFDTCLEADPQADQALNYLAYMWAESNQNLEQAMAYVERALAIKPESPAYLDTRAWVHYRQGDYAAALADMKRALAVMPDDPILNEHMGDTYDALDQRDQARHYWTQSVMHDPDNRSAAWKLDAIGADADRIVRQARKALKKKERSGE